MAENDFATNGNDGMAMIQNTRWSLGAEWRLGYNDMHGYEAEFHLGKVTQTPHTKTTSHSKAANPITKTPILPKESE